MSTIRPNETAPSVSSPAVPEETTSCPFFIVGASRSGTTMLRLMLNAHSQLAIPDEMNYFRHVSRRDLAMWERPRSGDEYRTLVRQYLWNRGEIFPGEIEDLEAVALSSEDRTLRGPYRALLDYWVQACGKEQWGEKTPHNIFYVDVLADMFPDARFIHLIRDPRAVVQSMNSSPYYTGETAFNALNWRKSIREGGRLLRTHVPSKQHLQLRYEDLVLQTESSLRSVCRFLGAPFEPQMLRFYETADEQMAGPIRTPAIRSPVSEKGLSKWRRRLPPDQIAVVENLCGKEMDALGYEPATEGSFPLSVVPKILYWQWKVWQHRRKRGFEVDFAFLSGLRARWHRWGWQPRSVE